MVRNIILSHLTAVFSHFLLEKIHRICFLQQYVSCILLILQDIAHCGFRPACSSSGRQDSISLQCLGDLFRCIAAQIAQKNPQNDLRSFRIHFRVSVCSAPITDEILIVELAFSFLESAPYTHRNILAISLRFTCSFRYRSRKISSTSFSETLFIPHSCLFCKCRRQVQWIRRLFPPACTSWYRTLRSTAYW